MTKFGLVSWFRAVTTATGFTGSASMGGGGGGGGGKSSGISFGGVKTVNK